MTEPTDNLNPPATFEQPSWKPPARHRVDPMRPANHPIIADTELEDLYQDFYQERLRDGRTGPNLTLGLIGAVIFLILAACMVLAVLAWAWWIS